MKKRIFINDWLQFKPYKKHLSSDSYYLQISNDIYKIFLKADYVYALKQVLKDNEIKELSCFVTSYFEDIISETPIWSTFIRLNEKKIGKILPYYDTENYTKGETNIEDVKFLIWYFINSMGEGRAISPTSQLFKVLSLEIMKILDDEWLFAPENEQLNNYYYVDKKFEGYYEARKFIDTLLFKNWLFFPDTLKKLDRNEQRIVKEYTDYNQMESVLNEMRDELVIDSHTKLHNLKGKEWAAEILGYEHPEYEHYLNISKRVSGLFLYSGQDDNYIYLEHIATGKKINLFKQSIDYPHLFNEEEEIIFISMVKWKGEWWFSGIFFTQKYNSKIIEKEKQSLHSKIALDFLDKNNDEKTKFTKKQHKSFKAYNDGYEIAFMPVNEINDFIKNFIKFYNSSLKAKLSKSKNSMFDDDEEVFDARDIDENVIGLVYFDPNSGIQISYGICDAFPMKNNPYCDIYKSEEDIKYMLFSDDISPELVRYCIKHCADDLPYFKTAEGQTYLKDLDFTLSFFKSKGYEQRNQMTFI